MDTYKKFENIIVRMPNWLGDAVMATPLLTDLRKKWPNTKITILCKAHIAPLLWNNPYIDATISDGVDRVQRIREGNYDLGILLPNSFSSAWGFWRGGVPMRVGYSRDMRRLFLTHPLYFPKEKGKEHLVITYKRLLEPLGIPLSTSSPYLSISPEEKKSTSAFLRKLSVPEGAIVIGINPGAAYGSAKCWLPERFRQVAEKLLEHPKVFLLCFGDRTCESVARIICEGLAPRVINLVGATDLRTLMGLIEQCDLFLTNDSGPMHIAAALKTPLIALFGSTNEIATGPYEQGVVIHKHVSCSPCYKRVCPIDFRCMKRIEVAEVYEKISELLKQERHF